MIAPNSTVRNELRGLLGWMASLGGRDTQQTIVKLDPYTVFANGDASQLEPSVLVTVTVRAPVLAPDSIVMLAVRSYISSGRSGAFRAR